MRIEKPITQNIRDKANKTYLYLKLRYPEYVTKDELMKELGISNERQVRDIINTLRKKKPIISNSANKGYKLAIRKDDLEEVTHCWKEVDSRIEDLEETKKPLIEFYERMRAV